MNLNILLIIMYAYIQLGYKNSPIITMNLSQLPKLIGVLGRSRSGKDTTANIIMSLYPEQYILRRFAQPIKNALKEIYDFTPEQLEDDEKEVIDKRYNITPRQAMQEMTAHYLKKHGGAFFSERVFTAFDISASASDSATVSAPFGIIIPDVRYEHDINAIRNRGGIIIKVTRPSLTINQQHTVEDNIQTFEGDFTIVNDGDILHLKNKIESIFNQIL